MSYIFETYNAQIENFTLRQKYACFDCNCGYIKTANF